MSRRAPDRDRVYSIARAARPFALPPLQLRAAGGGFLALLPVAESTALRALADACVLRTNPHRAPPAGQMPSHRTPARPAQSCRPQASLGPRHRLKPPA